jgi:succinate dehydrogenase/fumarate reductase flavoprotein subunit
MKLSKTMQADVLVIGAGGAGLRAALAAAEGGSRVIVTNKGPIARSGITLTAAGGMQAPFHPEDSAEQYFQDTVKCGYGLGDRNLARVFADGACNGVLDAEHYGARFVRGADGEFSLGQFPGQSKPRNLFVKGGGVGLVAALAQACRRNDNIQMVDDFFVTGLVKANSPGLPRVAGAMGLDLKTGELTLIQAKAVVMATGGCQWLWEVNDCPSDATGDGVAYAYRAGAELVDMEMVLFYPSVIVWPPSVKGAFVHYEFLAADVLDGNVYDKDDNAVLPKPLPVRDEAMRLMEKAIRAGRGSAHGGLIWYVGDSPKGLEAVRKKLDIAQYNYIKSHGVDPSTAKVEVAPGAHYLMGGIHITDQCQTTLQGLFATPECAGNFDGANRLAGSGITATQVFGARAGLYANQWAAGNELATIDASSLEQETWRVVHRIGKRQSAASNVRELRDRLRAAVQLYAGVNRDQAGLDRLVEIAGEVQAAAGSEQASEVTNYNQELVDLLQLDIMCEIAQVVAGSALLRQESRGHHFRTDFPKQDDDNWLKHTMVVRTEKGPRFSTRPVI